MKFITENFLYIFEIQNNEMIIEDFKNFKIFKMYKNQEIIEFMKFLEEPKTIEEISSQFNFSKNEAEDLINSLKDKKFLKEYKDNKNKNLKVTIFGCGTFGSNIYSMLTKLGFISEITLIDYDVVEKDNIKRQFFNVEDIGKLKIEVLSKNNMGIKINKINKKIVDVKTFRDVIDDFETDLIVVCSDEPNWKDPVRWSLILSKEKNIPIISTRGYIGEVISLPEFYYPNDGFDEKGSYIQKNKLIFKSKNTYKAKYADVLTSSLIVNKQIIDFYNGIKPIYYGYRGFFDNENFEWKIEKK